MSGMTVSTDEVARFDALAGRWWDPNGPMRPLHRMNPVRVAWVTDRIRGAFAPTLTGAAGEGWGGGTAAPIQILDIGCGAGLAAEAFARLGFSVLGLDAAGEAIEAARAHAADQNLPLTYRTGTAEDLLAEGARFPIITALEVIEHVPDPATFVAILARLLAPDGQLFISTLNRTPQSFLAAKIGAEYLLRWLPVGTHDWRKFIAPAELAVMLRHAGLRVTDITGLVADPFTGRWHTSRNLSVNFLVSAAG